MRAVDISGSTPSMDGNIYSTTDDGNRDSCRSNINGNDKLGQKPSETISTSGYESLTSQVSFSTVISVLVCS